MQYAFELADMFLPFAKPWSRIEAFCFKNNEAVELHISQVDAEGSSLFVSTKGCIDFQRKVTPNILKKENLQPI